MRINLKDLKKIIGKDKIKLKENINKN